VPATDPGSLLRGYLQAIGRPPAQISILLRRGRPRAHDELRPFRRAGHFGVSGVGTLPPRQARRRRRSGHRLALWQPDRSAFWAYVAVMAGTGIYTVSQQEVFRRISPEGWTLSWGLLLFYALPAFALIYALDLYEREPLSLLIGSLLWGAIAATTLAGIANEGWGAVIARAGGPAFASRWTAALSAPWVEEILKGAGVVLIYLIARREMEDDMDGFVYGAVCGLGFAIVEDVVYFMGVFGGLPSGVLAGFVIRVLANGLYGHVLFSGLVGMAVAHVANPRRGESRERRLVVGAALVAASIAGHFVWNSPILDLVPRGPWSGVDWLLGPLAAAVKALPLVAFVLIAVQLARRREHRWLGTALASEVDGGAIAPGELRVLQDPPRRRAARREMRRRAGGKAAGLLRRLQREQVNLAMVRARATDEEDPDLVRQRGYCKSLRDALLAIPGAAPAGDPLG
jgi:RsiW-degrading membrane proteinase PrsW (M82 family)